MKKLMMMAVAAVCALPTIAESGDSLVFETVIANPVTSIKNQNNSGTCWCYSSLAFLESEAMKKNPKIKDYTIEDLNLMSKNPERSYTNKIPGQITISKIIAIIAGIGMLYVLVMIRTTIKLLILTGTIKRALIVIGVIAFFMILGLIENICDIDMSSGTNYSSGSSGGSDGSWFHPGSNMDNRQGYQSSWHDLYMFHHYGPKKEIQWPQ